MIFSRRHTPQLNTIGPDEIRRVCSIEISLGKLEGKKEIVEFC
jgi:hypothetical protein